MNIKRAFLTAVAVLMVPGYALAQSTVNFDVGANFFGQGDDPKVMAYMTCNAGLPMNHEFEVGGSDRVTFTVTEFTPGYCEVTFGDAPAGFVLTGVDIEGVTQAGETTCLFDDVANAIAATNKCTARYEAAPADFYVTVDWEVSLDADPGVGTGTEVEVKCDNSSTTYTYPAGPGATFPIKAATGVPVGDDCMAELVGYGSAVEVSPEMCTKTVTLDGGDLTCAFTATAFYEGIPTLSQYGMAIMALLMLGVGFVGFRRFV